METYSYSEAKQKLSMILDKANKLGKVLIKRKDGSVFEVKSVPLNKSPLDVEGIDIGLSKREILNIIKEIRKR